MKKMKTSSIEKHSVVANNSTTAADEKIVIYTDDNGNTELRADIKQETVWASQEQISHLFNTKRPAITKHISNIFRSKELSQISVCSILEHTAVDGKKYAVKYYNLDVIIAVGYRVNSRKATQFRIWATRILRDYIVRGYSLDNKIMASSPEKIEGLREAIELIQSNKNPGKLKGKITIKLTKNMEAK